MVGQFECPQCGTLLPVTAAPARCPHCKAQLPISQARSGSVNRSAASGLRSVAAPVSGLLGQLIDGRYRVVRVIGKGGYGVVYQAVDERVKRDVAVKMLLEKALDSPEAVARFKREADVLLKIVHPNVLPVFDTGQHGPCHYLAMSYVAGKSLKELIPPDGFPDPKRAVRLAITLAETLHYVYDRHKILHRDVKPANLMLADGDETALYLMDFGLAVAQDSDQARLTVDKSMMGTPAYMSPEQVRGVLAGIDHPTDIYSAGVTLYHMLTGKIPFTGTGFEIFVQITQTDADPPSMYRRDLDPALDRIVLKAMAKNPADRYPTARDFANALSLWVGSQSGVQRMPAARIAYSVPGREQVGNAAASGHSSGSRVTAMRHSTAINTAVSPPAWAHTPEQGGNNRLATAIALILAMIGLIVAIAVAVRMPSSGPRSPTTPTTPTTSDGPKWTK